MYVICSENKISAHCNENAFEDFFRSFIYECCLKCVIHLRVIIMLYRYRNYVSSCCKFGRDIRRLISVKILFHVPALSGLTPSVKVSELSKIHYMIWLA